MVFICPPRLPAPPQLGCGEYALPGPQVEPAASYWTECRPPCVITIQEILGEHFTLPAYPVYPDPVALDEIEELMELAALRDTPGAIFSNVPGRERRGISPFLQLRPQPLGAVFNKERAHDRCNDRCLDMPECQRECGDRPDEDDVPVILTGRELARYFESETPGIAHRLALNYLLPTTNWSPPRQALVWMALDVAIYSALGAAWYFKWRSNPGVSRRPRPIECDYRVSVLYNRAVDCDGDADGERRTMPVPSPGTPRHPAYPSGHSTYSAAASEILSYFFPDYAGEFDDLADNAGLARLWAGIHWRTDHTAGQLLGRFVAQRLIKQLRESCATALPDPCDPGPPCPPIPSIAKLDDCALQCCQPTREPEPDGGKDSGTKSTSTQSRSRSGRGRDSGQGRQGRSSTASASQASGPQEGAAPTGSRRDEAAQASGPQEGAPVSGSQEAEREAAQGPQEGAS
ncbi:MAG TPA: vanadium-dependent haloperoxidase [Chloroflexia bacterium]|nr:vanadium-dependent haloperoxidase [Chloroflexia bacterium]